MKSEYSTVVAVRAVRKSTEHVSGFSKASGTLWLDALREGEGARGVEQTQVHLQKA